MVLGIKQILAASSQGDIACRAHPFLAVAGTPVIAVSICHSGESQGWTMPAETKAGLIKLGHPLIGPPYSAGKRDKRYVQKEETKTPEAPG